MGRAGSLQRQLPSRTLSLPFKRSGSKLCLRFARQSLRTGVLKARAGQMPHGCPVNSYEQNSVSETLPDFRLTGKRGERYNENRKGRKVLKRKKEEFRHEEI